MDEAGRKTILLVDDEVIIAMMEKQQLEHEGYNVIYAQSGEEAVRAVCSCDSDVDLILMDIDLGRGIDGTEAASEILKEHDIPVVFLSSHREKEIVQRTENITSYGYVVKNSGIMVLDASIKMAFRLFDSRMKERRKKDALRESREIFRDLSDKAIVGIYFIQDGRFLYTNAMLAEILGYPISELISGMGPVDVVFEEDWPVVEENIARRVTGEEQSRRYEFRICTKSEEIRDVEVYSSRTIFNGKPAIIGTLVDITERKKAESEIRRINERFRLITENMSEGVVLSGMDMKIEYITPSVIKRHGYTLDELNSIPIEKRMSPESYERFLKMVSEELTPERLADPHEDIFRIIDLEYCRKDGTSCWSESSFHVVRDSDGKPAGVLGVGRDITERKHFEEALVESEERFRRLSEDIPAFISTSLPDSTITYANPALADMTGLSADRLVGKRFFDFLSNDERERVIKARDVLTPESPFEIHEQKHFAPDGSVRHHEWRNRAFFDENGNVSRYLSVGVDITERKLAEERLRLQTLAMEAAIDGIAILDAAENYAYLNRAHAEIYGYGSAGELYGRSWRILYDPDELERFDMEIMPRLAREGYFRGTATGLKKDGSRFSQEISLTSLDSGGLICIVRDITESKLVENAMRQSESKYRLLIEHTSDLIWNISTEGHLLYVSPSWKNVTGYEPAGLIGTSFRPLVHPEDFPVCIESFRMAVNTGAITEIPEHRAKFADGSWRWITATATPVIDPDGNVVSLVGISHDITGRKLAEDQVRNVLKEKELILKEVHHRVKNNMNTIFSLLVLQAEAQMDRGAKAVLFDSAGRVQSMMLLYEKLYRSEMNSIVPVKEYLPSLVSEIAAIFPNRWDVSIITEVDDFQLKADTLSPLGIIINELITNAMKYAFFGRKGGGIYMSATKYGNLVKILFEDNGPGMPDRAGLDASPGFGLHLIRMLVKQLRGSLKIESDSGTRFIIEFEV